MSEMNNAFVAQVAANVFAYRRRQAKFRTLGGIVVLILGVGLTVDSYNNPSGLGFYNVYYGAIVVGFLLVIVGIYRYVTAPRAAFAEAHARWAMMSAAIERREQQEKSTSDDTSP